MARFLKPTRKLLKSITSIPTLKTPNWLGSSSFSTYEETLLNIPPTRISVLDNGLRVASEDSGSPMATVGLWMHTGPRFEMDQNHGVTHFIEHLAFKGTKKRSQTDLELEVENLGAQLHSYVSREHTAFYAKCFPQDLPRIVEILSDIIQNGKFGESEIERERDAILREMDKIENNFQEVVLDHLHSVAFQGTPLAKNVLGTPENIKSMRQTDITDYVNFHYKAPRIVLAGAGGVDHDTMVLLAEEHFKGLKWKYENHVPDYDYCRYTGSDVRVRDDDLPLAHISIAFEGVGMSDPDYLPLMVAKTIVGSWDRTRAGGVNHSSRLALAGAQGNYCHSFQSFNISYKDTGLWGIYFVCERLTIDDFLFQLQSEWMHLCTDVTEFEVERAKNTLRTELLRQLDGTTSVCDDIGKQVLFCGRRIPFHEIDATIRAVDAEEIRDVLYKLMYDRCPAIAAVGPVEQLLDYTRIRSGFYRLRL